MQPGGMPRTDFERWNARTLEGRKQNRLQSADLWMVTDEVVFGGAICARFRGTWKHGVTRSRCEGLDGQRGEDAVWGALMHILEEWAEKSQRKRKRTNDTPGPTPEKPTTSGPSGQRGPSGQLEHLTPDSSICTPAVDPTAMADPTPVADPTPGVRPPVISSPPVRPLAVHPHRIRPPPLADTLGGLFSSGLQGLDED